MRAPGERGPSTLAFDGGARHDRQGAGRTVDGYKELRVYRIQVDEPNAIIKFKIDSYIRADEMQNFVR